MFSKKFGCYFVMGNFEAGKTFGTFLDLYSLDKKKNYIIANIPYKKVDLFYSTKEDLYGVFDDLDVWVKETNSKLELFDQSKFKDIHLVIDEAQLYFPSNVIKSELVDRLKVFLSQCRKRNISVYFIAQRTALVQKMIRRYSDFIIRYKRRTFYLLGTTWCRRYIYENEADISDINWEDGNNVYISTEKDGNTQKIEPKPLYTEIFFPVRKLFRKLRVGEWFSTPEQRELAKEKHLSKYISSLPDVNAQNSLNVQDLVIKK